jgi:hypothetical protein
MLKRKRPDGDIDSAVNNTKRTRVSLVRACHCEHDTDTRVLFATVWFCMEINYTAVMHRKDRKQEIVPFDVSCASVRPIGPWGYNHNTDKEAESLRFTIEPEDKHEDLVADTFVQSEKTSTVYFRRRLSKLEMRLLHGCLQPSTVRHILFDSDLGDAIRGYAGVANLIWEYADPSKRRLSFMEVKNKNYDTFASFDTSLYDTAIWEDIDWNAPTKSGNKYELTGMSSGDCVFDLTEWKPDVFD